MVYNQNYKHLNPTSNKTIAKNAIFLYIRMMVVMVVTFFTSRIVLQVLGETDYGIYNVVGGIVTMMAFLNGALGASTSRFLTYHLGRGDTDALKKTFAATLNLHILIAVLVIILGETVGLWFFYEKLNIPDDRIAAAFWVYQFSIITTCVNFTQVPFNASIISHENMSIYAYVGLYEAVSRLGIAYLIYVSPIDRLVFYALIYMFNTVLVQFFYRIYTKKRYEECRFQIVTDKALYKQLLSYGGWDLFGGLASVAQGQGINIVLNLFFGPSVNAARAIAVQIQTGVTAFVQNITVAFRPQVIKSYAIGDSSKMYGLTFKAAKYSYAVMLALTLPICFEITFILSKWLGASYPDKTEIFAILMLANLQCETIHSAFLMSYHAIGKIKLGNSICGTLMILSLPLSYLFLRMGAEAEMTFVVILLINIMCQLISWVIVHRYVPFNYRGLVLQVYLPCLSLTICSVMVPYFVVNHFDSSWYRLLITIILTEIWLFSLSWLIIVNKGEKIKIKQLIRNRICKH